MKKDLRKLTDEEFIKEYNRIKNKTRNFSVVSKELFLENPQFLFVIRLVLGFSQLELSKMINVEKQWIRHFETGRQGFKNSENIPKLIKFINEFLKKNHPLSTEKYLELLKRSRNAIKKWEYKYPEPKYKLKRISEMERKDFIKYFKLLEKETDGFSVFDPMILIKTPVFITIFRIVLDMSLNEFCRSINFQTRRIRKYERFEERIMPETASYIMNIIKNKMKDRKISLEDSIQKFEKMTPFNEIELKIKRILEKSKISSDIHANLISGKKEMNIDFLVPNKENPLVAIEVTKLSNVRRKDITNRIVHLDHKFQLIKLKNKNIFTIMVIECSENYKELVKRYIEREVVNTDASVVNEITSIPMIIKIVFTTN